MAINFQQVREQVKSLGENAAGRLSQLQELRLHALELLNNHAGNLEGLRQRVQEVAHRQDPNLRCAIPCAAEIARPEPLDGHYPLPELPAQATIVAADGSQITPDRHAQVNFCLINVGAIQVRMGAPDPPQITVSSKLIYDEQLYTLSGTLSEAQVALMRDLNERKWLAGKNPGENRPSAGDHVYRRTDGAMGSKRHTGQPGFPAQPGRIPAGAGDPAGAGSDYGWLRGQAGCQPGGAPAGGGFAQRGATAAGQAALPAARRARPEYLPGAAEGRASARRSLPSSRARGSIIAASWRCTSSI